MKNTNRAGMSLIELLVVVAIIGVLFGMLLPAVQQSREAATIVRCHEHLRQIGIALHSFHDAHSQFPEDDGHSKQMFVSLLPYLEQPPSPSGFQPVSVFLCPTRRSTEVGPRTDYAAAAQESLTPWGWKSVLGADDGSGMPAVRLDDLASHDGASATAMLGHKAMMAASYRAASVAGDPGWSVTWNWQFTTPRESIDRMDHQRFVDSLPTSDARENASALQRMGSPHPVTIPCVYADGSVRAPSQKPAGVPDVLVWIRAWSWNDGQPSDS